MVRPVSVCVCVSLGYVLNFAIGYTCERKSSSYFPQLGQRPWDPGWAPVAEQDLFWDGVAGGGGHPPCFTQHLPYTSVAQIIPSSLPSLASPVGSRKAEMLKDSQISIGHQSP